MKRRASGHYQIEIRDRRLKGGRMSISARTPSAPVARRREAAVRAALDQGMAPAIERVRAGEIHIAEFERAAAEGRLDRLCIAVGSVVLLGPVIDRVLEVVAATRAAGTLKQYRLLARHLVAEWGRDADLREIGRDEVRAFLHRRRKGRSRSPRSQAQIVALAGRIWREAMERDAEAAERAGIRPQLIRNPWRDVETPEVRPTRVSFLLPAQWRTLAETVRGRPEAAVLALGCLAGLRLREVTHLRVGLDVDLDTRRLLVQARAGEYPWRPKTRRGERTIRISDQLLEILDRHVALGYAGDRYLIRTLGQDRPVGPGTVARWTEAAFTAAGIPYGRTGEALTYHSLRHTFASWLVQRDTQLKKIAMLMGDTVLTVERTYAHLLPSDLDNAVDLVSAIAGDAE